MVEAARNGKLVTSIDGKVLLSHAAELKPPRKRVVSEGLALA
jgi:hypothetical protein